MRSKITFGSMIAFVAIILVGIYYIAALRKSSPQEQRLRTYNYVKTVVDTSDMDTKAYFYRTNLRTRLVEKLSDSVWFTFKVNTNILPSANTSILQQRTDSVIRSAEPYIDSIVNHKVKNFKINIEKKIVYVVGIENYCTFKSVRDSLKSVDSLYLQNQTKEIESYWELYVADSCGTK